MKNRKILIVLIIFLLMSLVILTGCSNKKTSSQDEKEKISVEETNDENKVAIRLNGASEFVDGIAVVSETINFQNTNYVIDSNFNVLSTFEGNNQYIGGYMIKQKEDKNYEIVDPKGKEVFSYGQYEYDKVELVGNGCVLLVKKTETYNSSNTVAGIYDLKQGKYILETSEEYIDARVHSDNLVSLDSSDTKFFNTKTQKVITFETAIMGKFIDGYCLDEEFVGSEEYYLNIWDENGGFRKVRTKDILGGSFAKDQQNGMLFYSEMDTYRNENGGESIKMYSSLFNLETGEIIDFGSEEYSMPTNKVKYTTDGYALLTFENQGGTPYYTILDKKGNKVFEPIKVNDNAAFQPNDNGEKRIIRLTELFEGNYLIVEEDGVDTLLDMNNKILVQAEENESFVGITNGVLRVSKKEPGRAEEHYYKDFKGNKIQIYK